MTRRRASTRRGLVLGLAAVSLAAISGCKGLDLGWWNFFDPSRPVRPPEEATLNLIHKQIGPGDQTEELVPNAEPPKHADLEFTEEDYVIGPTDILRIAILDLYQEGMETVLERQVTHSGSIQLPLPEKRIPASGLTAEQLTEAIKKALVEENVLKEPITASVTVVVPRQNLYSILGMVARPGPYAIPRRNFTVLEALAAAGDVVQANIEWIYVIRPQEKGKKVAPTAAPGGEPLPPLPTLPTAPAGTLEEKLRELEKFVPGARASPSRRTPGGALDDRTVSLSDVGDSYPAQDRGPERSDVGEAAVTYKWVYSNGRWVRVAEPAAPGAERVAPTGPTEPAEKPEKPAEDPFGWKQYDLTGAARIIAVNLPALKRGEARMNVIIRDNDIIHVPPLQIGEFYVMGEVLRPGPYALTGRNVTVKQAVAAAGNLGVLSWPDNSVLIRRVGGDQEQTIKLPLNDIFAGRENDIFLKPDDVIAVGSHWAAPFLAVWRNAFRMTYGFGFIYDRNYSDREFEIPILMPRKGYRIPG